MSDTPSDSTSRLWADLLAGDDIDENAPAVTAADIDRQSMVALASRFARDLPEKALLGPQTPGATVGRVRLFGPAIEDNAVTFGLASKVLTVVQDALSVVGMSIRGKKTVNGAVPKLIREATLLRLHPQIGRGSVVLKFEGPQRPVIDDRLGGTASGPNLADQAATSLLGIFDQAGLSDSEGLTPSLQDLGPRVASHVRRLAALTLKDKVYLDLRWMQANGIQRSGRLTAEGGQFLETFISETKASVERQVLRTGPSRRAQPTRTSRP